MKITCVDPHGKEHCIEESEFIDRPAVYGLLQKDGKILLVKDPWSKKWGLPGGGIDEGEHEEEALIREFQEETGLIISPKMEKLFSDISYFLFDEKMDPWRTLRSIYEVQLLRGTLLTKGNSTDVIEANFFDRNTIANVELQANMPQVFERIFS